MGTNNSNNTRCWCTIPQLAQTANMDMKDRLNPGRAYYRCGNFGKGATCSFFAWVQVALPQPPQPQQPQCPGIKEAPKSPRLMNRTPEKERRQISALTVALKTRIKITEADRPSPAKKLDEELEALFGKKKRRRARSTSKHEVTLNRNTPAASPIKQPQLQQQPQHEEPIIQEEEEGIRSPYYSSSSPLSIPKVRNLEQRRLMFDKLTELDKKCLKKNQESKNGKRRPSTFPLNQSTTTTSTSRRACFNDDIEDNNGDDFFDSFPCSFKASSPFDILLNNHTRDQQQCSQTDEILWEEERGIIN